jgi:hypothetical protein
VGRAVAQSSMILAYATSLISAIPHLTTMGRRCRTFDRGRRTLGGAGADHVSTCLNHGLWRGPLRELVKFSRSKVTCIVEMQLSGNAGALSNRAVRSGLDFGFPPSFPFGACAACLGGAKVWAAMPMSSEKKAKLLLATSEAAGAFVEDMGHIRDTLAKADRTTPAEIRRLSAVLRRLLIHDDLRSISSPRIGALSFLIPDNNHAARKQSVRIFLSGGLSVFNNEVRAIVTSMTGNFRLDPAFDKTKTATVKLEGFLNQMVLAHNNKWATRGQVIKYIANKSSGVSQQVNKRIFHSRGF